MKKYEAWRINLLDLDAVPGRWSSIRIESLSQIIIDSHEKLIIKSATLVVILAATTLWFYVERDEDE